MSGKKQKPALKENGRTPAPESVRALQRRVQAFAATGATNNSPVTYHR